MSYTEDWEIWEKIAPEDLWVLDKLILSKRLGYLCGPKGVDVPYKDLYVVRPCVNFMGMGRGAKLIEIESDTDKHKDIPIGYFWCEVFTGRHLSVDYVYDQQVLCVEGFRYQNSPLYRFNKWKRVGDEMPYPEFLRGLTQQPKYVNVEYIGDKIIEIHFRHNPDFQNGELELIPVWKGDKIEPPEDFVFIPNKDFKREGFYVKWF